MQQKQTQKYSMVHPLMTVIQLSILTSTEMFSITYLCLTCPDTMVSLALCGKKTKIGLILL